jgi:GT2 family glycosyltransferase
MSNTRVSIIILNWNSLGVTADCLESLKKIDYPAYDIVVVDNGSSGNDADVLEEKYAGYIHLIRNKENLGYAAGIDAGISYVTANLDSGYVLLLNNDTIVDPLFLKLLVEAGEADSASGIIGPKVYYYDYPDRLQSAGNTIDMYTGRFTMVGSKQVDKGQYDHIKETDYFAPCLLIKHKVIEDIGVLDEKYFCYWEDVDYCTRARRRGYKITYVAASKIWHRTPVKLKLTDKPPQGAKIASIFPYYYITRNSWLFMRKHATRLQFGVFCLYFFTFNFFLMTGA